MSRKNTRTRLGLVGAIVAALVISRSGAGAPVPNAEKDEKAPPAENAPDLRKQIDDALKELDKLDQIPDVPPRAREQIDGVRRQMRQFGMPQADFLRRGGDFGL